MQNLRTTICECGFDLKVFAQDGNRHIMKAGVKMPKDVLGEAYDSSFYGGRVIGFADVDCECGKRYRLYLEDGMKSVTYRVIDMATIAGKMKKTKKEDEPKE